MKPGEINELSFTLSARQMALINEDGECILEPGVFEVFLGGSQPDQRSQVLTGAAVLSGTFEVTGKPIQVNY